MKWIQLTFGVLLGILGMALATSLMVMILIVVRAMKSAGREWFETV